MNIEKIDRNFATKQGDENGICYINCLQKPFKLYGVLPPDRESDSYYRMPTEVARAINPEVEILNFYTSGGRVRFITDSQTISVKIKYGIYIGRTPCFSLTGCAGLDLYSKTPEGKHKFHGTFIPPLNVGEEGFCSTLNVGKGLKEFTINFPLYSAVRELYIGVETGSALLAPKNYTIEKPVVYYGSSITQGGCASRPGNCYQSILSREFDCNFINLGFSGNARGENTMAEYIAGLDMSLFVYDYDHNANSAEELEKTHRPMFEKIRKSHPDLPIIMLSRPNYHNEGEVIRNNIIKETYESAKQIGDKSVWFIDGSIVPAILGGDSITVDGTHPNDLGFMCMAKVIGNVMKDIL